MVRTVIVMKDVITAWSNYGLAYPIDMDKKGLRWQ
jgi:hypothetical protein